MDDLITFLRDCLDDDERVARKCAPGPWVIQGEPRESYVVSAAGVAVALGWLRDAAHIARWDPARVLAEIDAKRRIIDRYQDLHWHAPAIPGSQFPEHRVEDTGACRTCVTVRLLALPYADRPGYRPEWNPDAGSGRLSEPSAAQEPPAGGIGCPGPSEGESGGSR